jgi:hypothetical protein
MHGMTAGEIAYYDEQDASLAQSIIRPFGPQLDFIEKNTSSTDFSRAVSGGNKKNG